MKRLDKFSLLIETPEIGKEVKRIADKAGINTENWGFSCNAKENTNHWSTYIFINGGFSTCVTDKLKIECPLITFDQFKQMFEPKIIGYKCPIDLFGGNIKKDTVYKRVGTIKNGYYPFKESGMFINRETYVIPQEIVETWEPIYEEVNTELDNLKSEAEQLKNQLDKVMNAINELDKK